MTAVAKNSNYKTAGWKSELLDAVTSAVIGGALEGGLTDLGIRGKLVENNPSLAKDNLYNSETISKSMKPHRNNVYKSLGHGALSGLGWYGGEHLGNKLSDIILGEQKKEESNTKKLSRILFNIGGGLGGSHITLRLAKRIPGLKPVNVPFSIVR